MNFHMIFYVSMEDFHRNYGLVAEGHVKSSVHHNLRKLSVAVDNQNFVDIIFFERFSCEVSGHPYLLHNVACHI